MGGPLKHLENKWKFRQTGDSSEVDFHVDFELKNKILNILMIKTFDLGLKKIADAFEKRANELFNNT
jgi:coenzyme Q-binding protein COQ10